MNTSTLNIGDRVLVRQSYGWSGCRHKPGTVSKKTPSGIVDVSIDAYPPHGTIAHTKRFKASGWESGHDNYRGDCLEPFCQETLDNEILQAKTDRAKQYLQDGKWIKELGDSSIRALAAHIEILVKEQS